MAWNKRANEEEQPVRKRMSIAQAAAWTNPVSGDETEQVSVRKAVPEDAEKIYGYLQAMHAVQARKRPDIVDQEDEILSLEEVQEALADPDKDIFVAVNKTDKLVGQILCEYEQAGEDAEAGKLVIANIYVTEDSRRVGIGTQLYNEAYLEAKKKGVQFAELSCWNFDSAGMAFFERLGFSPLLVTMEKKIGD